MKFPIHVPLRSNRESLREVDAEPVGDGRFRLTGRAARGELLRFKSGQIVECEARRLPDGSNGLVAVRAVSEDPEFRKRRKIYAVLGALVGGVFGAAYALWFSLTPASFAIGALLGAIAFAFCSARWGDAAWEILSRIVR